MITATVATLALLTNLARARDEGQTFSAMVEELGAFRNEFGAVPRRTGTSGARRAEYTFAWVPSTRVARRPGAFDVGFAPSVALQAT